MAKKKTTDKPKEKPERMRPKLSGFLGKKLKDISSCGEDNSTTLHFSNGFKLKLRGDVSLTIEE